MQSEPNTRLVHPAQARLPPARWPAREEAARSLLFAPIRYGASVARTRTWVPAMVPWRASAEGFVTPAVLDWYGRLADGRPGVLVVEATGIRDVPSGPLLRIGDQRFVSGLAELVRVVRERSGGQTRLFVQILDFLGIKRRPEKEKFLRRFLVLRDEHRAALGLRGASEAEAREALLALPHAQLLAILSPREREDLEFGARERVTDTQLPHVAELPRVLPGLFAEAARRAREAGFDGVELHYAHAYTLASFLSRTNTREDGYGGTPEARLRLPLEVLAAVRARAGADFTVGCRILGDEVIAGGSRIEDAAFHAAGLARAGVDFLSISKGGRFEDARQPRVGEAAYPYTGPSGLECMPTRNLDARGPFGRNLELSRAIRSAVRAAGCATPVGGAGGINDFELAERALREADCDFVAAARQSLADPDWWMKLELGRGAEIRRCIYSNYCEALDQRHREVTCQLWDRDLAAHDPGRDGIARTSDGKRRLVPPPWSALLALVCLWFAACAAPEPDPGVGELPGGGHLLATGQRVQPAGRTSVIDGRPLDLVLSADGARLYVKEAQSLLVFERSAGEVRARLPLKGGASMHGIALAPGGTHLWLTGAEDALHEFALDADGLAQPGRTLALPPAAAGGAPYPCGLALTPDGARALVCLSRDNSLAVVALDSGRVEARIAVGVAPYDVVLDPDGRTAWVSCLGGRRPHAGERSSNSSGTPILVDERGIGTSGVVVRVDLEARSASAELECGLHPTDLELDARAGRLYVAAAGSDAVFAIDTARARIAERIELRPDPALPAGSRPGALALAPDGRTLFVANAGNDAVALVELGQAGRASRVSGFVPTGWFPGALLERDGELVIANVKGTGARGADAQRQAWKATRDRGSLQFVRVPDASELARLTRLALDASRVPEALREHAARPRVGIEPVPVPERAGEPSTIRHVVYVIKENRTYDQVLGDLPRGNGAARLCVFGREVTPNHHALAEQFVLLDNYYCNGVVSADGHQWATQAISVEYLEKQFGGWTRCYDLGTDALTYAASGFLWDAVLGRGLTFRNWGEFDLSVIDSPRGDWFEVQRAARAGELRWHAAMPQQELARFSAPDYPGWELRISDQFRVERFLEELARMESSGEFPSLALVYLPQDHTSGTKESAPTPRACVADNDLALGRLVAALSKSRFWPEMAIFVNEDDPQDGWDHVDGHRSLCLVASPWAKRGARVSRFYDQTSVLRTIERILGLPSLTQRDAGSPVMSECFTRRPDFRPYAALPNRVPLDERNPKKTADAREFDLRAPDRIDDDAFNRVIWSSLCGSEPYPAAFAGAHGKGLAALGLKLGERDEEDDDD